MHLLLVSFFLTLCSAAPFIEYVSHTHSPRDFEEITEWTAIGDSYATGVGAGNMDEFRRCFRFDGAYPRQMNQDFRLTGDAKKRKFNNVACSGATSKQILAEQFRDDDSSNWQYGKRPAFGKPQLAVVHVGGDDIDFFGLVNNCIYQIIPYNLCSWQLENSWRLLRKTPENNDPNETSVKGIASVIKATVDKGRKGVGKDFKVYVPAYPRFFNQDTDICTKKTWNLYVGGRVGTVFLTKDLRNSFNDMSNVLNKAVQAAVSQYKDMGVSYVEWNNVLEGHRYCEYGVDEPQPDNQNVWFFNYLPIIDTRGWSWLDKVAMILDPSTNNYKAFREAHDNGGNYKVNSVPITAMEVQRAMNEAIFGKDEGKVNINSISDDIKGTFVNLVKVFHPKTQLHKKIMEKVFAEYSFANRTRKEGLKCYENSNALCITKDKAISAADTFCKQKNPPSNKPHNPYSKTADEMIISLRNDIDEKAVIKSHDDCLAVFKTILNKCDRNNPALKPQKHSLGGSYRTKDGWVYFIQPLKSNPDCKLSVEPAKPSISKKCRGVNTKKYLNRKTLAENIKTYCAEAARQGIQDKGSGSLERKYNTGTMEKVSISMNWPSGLAFKLKEDECNKYITEIMDGCDGNNPENPMNWKAGGSFRVDKVEYVIQPMASRPTAPKKTWAHCKTRYDFLYDSYWIQGGGWSAHDGGKGIRAKLNGCAGSAYHFKYETGEDGKTPQEWSISGHAPIWKKKCITKAIKSAGGPSDIKCSGSG